MALPVQQNRAGRSIIPWLFPAGLGLVIVVNMVMAWFAIDTFPGVATRNAYERGRSYGRVLERDEAIAAMGWQVDVRLRSDGRESLVVHYRNRDGEPIVGLEPFAVLTRPLGERTKVEVRLAEAGAGVYQAVIDLPYRGQWDAQISADDRPAAHIATARLNAR
jgi:nitrogen fixation protein FixH